MATQAASTSLHPALHTRLCDIFGVRYPIIQTAMGWVATPEVVAGTANAGALGFLACAVQRADEADRAIARVKELTERPFGVNFLMEQPGAEQIVESIVKRGVKAASGHGLGLATAKIIVEGHGGRILVSSQANEGSTFTIFLP